MSDWVKCPVCGEPDMQSVPEGDEDGKIISCTNLACASNGGSNCSALNLVLGDELTNALHENEFLRRSMAEAVAVNGRLRLLENVSVLEGAALGTFLKGGDIPSTIAAARGALVLRALNAEKERDEAHEFLRWLDGKGGLGSDVHGMIRSLVGDKK